MTEAMEKASNAKKAFLKMSTSAEKQRNKTLTEIIVNMKKNKAKIVEANSKDVAEAKANALPQQLVKRLELSKEKFDDILHEVKGVAKQENPLGKQFQKPYWTKDLSLNR